MAWDTIARWLLCPHCKSPLDNEGRVVRCARGHTFDIARQGYLNLLATGGKKRLVGDTAEMVAARRRFLDRGFCDRGFYQPLSDAINATALHCLAETLPRSGDITAPLVVDAGCGEGYYLARLREVLAKRPAPSDLLLAGCDLSREAIRMAAQRQRACAWLVADTNDVLPYGDDSVSLLLTIFAPRNAAQFARIIAPGGYLIIVIPTPRHLGELRAVAPLIGIEVGKGEHVRHQLSTAFSFQSATLLEYPIALNRAVLTDLIRMTPNQWHLTSGDWRDIARIAHVYDQVSCEILVFRRKEQDATAAAGRAVPPGRRPRRGKPPKAW